MSINTLTHGFRLALSLGLSALRGLPAPTSVTIQTRSQKHCRVVASNAQRPLLILTAFLLLLLIGTLVANRATLAGNGVGSFEIDGNLTVDHLVPPGEPID